MDGCEKDSDRDLPKPRWLPQGWALATALDDKQQLPGHLESFLGRGTSKRSGPRLGQAQLGLPANGNRLRWKQGGTVRYQQRPDTQDFAGHNPKFRFYSSRSRSTSQNSVTQRLSKKTHGHW